jgi:hypothetical protein
MFTTPRFSRRWAWPSRKSRWVSAGKSISRRSRKNAGQWVENVGISANVSGVLHHKSEKRRAKALLAEFDF